MMLANQQLGQLQPDSRSSIAACRRALRDRKRWRVFAVFVLLWSGMSHDAAQAEGLISFCRNVDERISVGEGGGVDSGLAVTAALLDSRIPEGFAADVDTVWKLVRKLHHELDIPLSFIENEADEPIALPAAEQTLAEVLRAIADQHERYRCEAYAGRLVLRSSDPVFDVTISGVDVVEEYRFPAMYAYLDHLRASDQRFKDWSRPLFTTAGDSSPVSEGRVTLSPRAPVVLHLVQLLGKNRDLYFEVPAPSQYLPGRTIRFGAVRRQTGEKGGTQPTQDLMPQATFCQSIDGSSSRLLNVTPPKIGDVTSVDQLVEVLHHHHGIPISFIGQTGMKGWGNEPLRLPKSELTLDELLEIVADQYPIYACEIRAGRLILRTKDPIFDTMISGVDIANEGRSTAVLAYLEHLRAFDDKFVNWSDGIRAIVGEDPWPSPNEEKVSLAPRNSLIDHLVQLLGREEYEFFSAPYLHPGAPRAIYTNRVVPRLPRIKP